MPSTTDLVERHFGIIGARVRFGAVGRSGVALDIRHDRRGEYFELRLPERASARVVDADRADRHLLMLVDDDRNRSRFLCGHDERHWFVAAIPERAAGVVNVETAKEALQPTEVRQAAAALRPGHRLRRRNRAYRRQGEWFFVPVPGFEPDPRLVLHAEPLSRGRGQPHVMEHAYRRDGTVVYVSRAYPRGISRERFAALPEDVRRTYGWRQMVSDAEVFAMGRIRHRDHATLALKQWHRVLMNTEAGARAMRHVAFLD